MPSVLPVSDLDNPHFKKHMRSSFSRMKLTTVVGVLVFIGLALYGLSRTDTLSNYHDYLSKNSGTSFAGGQKASTLECARSYDGKRPVDQYVVMLDAGSSGSRVHVYHFNNCQKMPQLVDEEFKMKEPGLSSYDDPQEAAKSLDSLLAIAKQTVPEDLQKCTPVSVMATAGLRALGEEKSEQILKAVRTRLETEYPFPVVEKGVEIMSGEDEGIYAWITANFLLGNIGTADKTPTVAVFDLGGGSTQIVFEPTFRDAKQQLSEGDHRRELSFGGRDFVLYQHSYLGYGLNAAVSKINQEIVKRQSVKGLPDKFANPCLPPGTTLEVKTKVPDGTTSLTSETSEEKVVTFEGPSVPAPLQCRAIAESILDKNHVCAMPPCSFGGVYQPKLLEAFPIDSDMFVFSFFYDRTAPLGMPSTFSLSELTTLTHLVCSGEAGYSAFAAFPNAIDELKKNPQWCTELTYMDALLRSGYELKSHRDVTIAKKIKDRELGWCLGASLPLLDRTKWKCRT